MYVSTEITNFQKDLFFKEHFWSWKLSILSFILSIILPVISYSRIWNKIQSVWQHIGKNFSINEVNFRQVQWRTFSEGPSLHHNLLWTAHKIFSNFRESSPKVQQYAIISFLIHSCGLLIRVFSYFIKTFQ